MQVLIIAFWVLELLAVLLYIKSCWPERTRKSFYVKLACSSIFMVYAIMLAVLIRYGINVSFAGSNAGELSAGANTFLEFYGGGLTDRVVHLVLAALAYGWIGDQFLSYAHVLELEPSKEVAESVTPEQMTGRKNASNALGILSFFLGNILYCVAFGRAMYGYEAGIHWWSVLFLLVPLLMYVLMAVRMDLGKRLVPAGFYFLSLGVMFAMSMTLGIQLWHIHKLFSACLMVGSVLFTFSDIALALETYGGEKFLKLGLRVTRQIAYFFGQMCLATTILYFYTV
ncbi:MAG: hypothetical protein IJ051_08105 [Clostridia bacterium]|nr:hypothetical protein [Clostridia bacterium]